MLIHVVQPEETARSIANLYGLPVERFIIDNGIPYPNHLVPGDSLVILYPEKTYVVQAGDTLAGIAEANGVSVLELLRNNPYLSDRVYLTAGETLVIKYSDKKTKKISVNGYAYPFIEKNILRKTLPYLTYLTIYNYKIMPDGNLIDINDDEVIRLAKEYGTAPIMLITFPNSKTVAGDVIHIILTNKNVQNHFINNVLHILNSKGYYGINFDMVYIYPQDRQLYYNFMMYFIRLIRKQGYKVFNTFSASTFELLTGIAYSGSKYANINQCIGFTILLPYELGKSIGIPLGAIDFHTVKELITAAKIQMPPRKVQLGISEIGYIWKLPYMECVSCGNAISGSGCVEYARVNNVPIEYDERTESAYLIYIEGNSEYFVRYKDARSVNAYIREVIRTDLDGVGVWNIMVFSHGLWLIINSQFEIDKVMDLSG